MGSEGTFLLTFFLLFLLVDPLQATVDAVLERSGSLYSVEQVTACVMSMYDRCIRYDDPDSVLEQLSLVSKILLDYYAIWSPSIFLLFLLLK